MGEGDPLDGTPYRTVRVLGEGGMGTVLLAEHRMLGKEVAVKLLQPELASRPEIVDRLRVEAKTLARLKSPHLVAVHDFGATRDGRPFMVMERLVGRTVYDEVAGRGPLPVPEALDVARQALVGLEAAHRVGVVHRDIKCENLFLCDPDRPGARRTVKVLDFGIAKVERNQSTADMPIVTTDEFVTIGTPVALSPEQIMGAPVDARTDVYAMGVVLYTMLTGGGPFDHLRRVEDIVAAHFERVPSPPSSRAPEQQIGKPVDEVVLKALEKTPNMRYPSAAMFALDLEMLALALEQKSSVRGARVARPVSPEREVFEVLRPHGRHEWLLYGAVTLVTMVAFAVWRLFVAR